MSYYIGRSPQIGAYSKLDAITTDGSASYTMQLDSANFVPESVNHLIVSVNGVIQAPTDSFTVSGSTITFASSLSVSDTIDFIMALGNVLDIGVPSDSTVSLSKLTATGTKDATTFLRGDNTFAEVPAGGITEADQWRLTTAFLNDAQPISSNLERNDTSFSYIGTGMTESSGIFTFPSTGIYLVKYNITTILGGNGEDNKVSPKIEITTDNSSYSIVADSQESLADHGGGTTARASQELNIIFDVTDTTTHKVRFSILVDNTQTQTNGSSIDNRTYFTFIRLGDT